MTAWKAWERQVCADLGGRRGGPIGAAVSDCVGVPWAVECKRSARGCVLTSWLAQAKEQGRNEGKQWLLPVRGHNDRRPTVTLEWAEFLRIARLAGLIPDTNQEEAV